MPVEVGGVAAGEAGGAKGRAAGGAEEGFFRQVIEGVGADELPDFLYALGRAYQRAAGEPGEVFFFEDILHEAGAFMDLQRAIVCRHNHAAALLAAVLEGLEGEECEVGCMFYSVDSKDAAFFV